MIADASSASHGRLRMPSPAAIPSTEQRRQAAAILATFDDAEVKALISAERAKRRRQGKDRRDAVLRKVAVELLSDLAESVRADELYRAARGHRSIARENGSASAGLPRRHAVRRRLLDLLGDLQDVPGPRRIAQILGGK